MTDPTAPQPRPAVPPPAVPPPVVSGDAITPPQHWSSLQSAQAGPCGAAQRRGPLRPGERVQLTDAKGRMHTITLATGAHFFTHRGSLPHDGLIGAPDGSTIHNTAGVEYLALRPLLADYVMSMPRGAQVVYPKDAGQIVAMGDIFPGAHVVEAGVGSGALSMSLLRAVGDGGRLHSFERREEFATIARANVETFFGGPHPAWQLTIGDVVEELPRQAAPGSVDRVVLDLLTPWECLQVAAEVLAPGGVLICYVATVSQLSRLTETARDHGGFTEPSAWESMVRGWHLEGLAVRPEHRMHGHTGFLLTTRRLAPDTIAPRRTRRPAASAYDDEGQLRAGPWQAVPDAAWEPEQLGERAVSERVLRRRVRAAEASRPEGTAEQGDVVDQGGTADQEDTAEQGDAVAHTDPVGQVDR